jgi:hypothetical protein
MQLISAGLSKWLGGQSCRLYVQLKSNISVASLPFRCVRRGQVELQDGLVAWWAGMSSEETAGYQTASSGRSLTISECGETGACSEVS